MDDKNPYRSPTNTSLPPVPIRTGRRWVPLLLPLAVPPIFHPIVHFFIAQEEVANASFMVVVVVVGMGWAIPVVDRFHLTILRAVFLKVAIVAATIATAIFTVWVTRFE